MDTDRMAATLRCGHEHAGYCFWVHTDTRPQLKGLLVFHQRHPWGTASLRNRNEVSGKLHHNFQDTSPSSPVRAHEPSRP